MKAKKWFAVPSYKKGEAWKILNEDGEMVAKFEIKEDCLLAVDAVNGIQIDKHKRKTL